MTKPPCIQCDGRQMEPCPCECHLPGLLAISHLFGFDTPFKRIELQEYLLTEPLTARYLQRNVKLT